jgi:hypothetical protein
MGNCAQAWRLEGWQRVAAGQRNIQQGRQHGLQGDPPAGECSWQRNNPIHPMSLLLPFWVAHDMHCVPGPGLTLSQQQQCGHACDTSSNSASNTLV